MFAFQERPNKNSPFVSTWVWVWSVRSNSLPCLMASSGFRVYRSSNHNISSVETKRRVWSSQGASIDVNLTPGLVTVKSSYGFFPTCYQRHQCQWMISVYIPTYT